MSRPLAWTLTFSSHLLLGTLTLPGLPSHLTAGTPAPAGPARGQGGVGGVLSIRIQQKPRRLEIWEHLHVFSLRSKLTGRNRWRGAEEGVKERGAQQAVTHGWPRAVCLPVHPSPTSHEPAHLPGSQGATGSQPAHGRGRCCCSDVQEEASWEVSPTKRPLPTSTSPECTWASRALSHPTSHRPGSQQE